MTPHEDHPSDSEEAKDVSSNRPTLAALAAITLGIGLTEPVVPLFARELGAGPLAMSMVVATRWGSRLFTNIPAGIVTDRCGRRGTLMAGAAAVAAAALIAAGAQSWEVLLVSRTLEGLGAGALMTALLASLTDRTEDDLGSRATVYGHYQAIHRIGFWIGPTVGAAAYGAVGARAVMVAYAVLTGVGFLLSFRIAETHGRGLRTADTERIITTESVGALLQNRAFVFGSLLMFGSFFTLTGTQFTAMPLHFTDLHQLGPSLLSLSMFTLNAVGFVLIYPSAWMADRVGRRPPVIILALVGTLGLLVLGSRTDVTGVLVASVLIGGATALRGPALQAFIMDAAGPANRGASAGLFRALGDVGSALGPVVVGLTAAADYTTFFLLNAAVLGVCALLFTVGTSRRPGFTG